VILINVRKWWIDTSSDYSSKEEIISNVKDNYDIRRYYSAEGKSTIIDGITTQVIIQSHLNPLNEGKYDKKIHMPIETVVNTGSIIEWENDKWIIVSNIDNLQAYKTASMVKSNNTLKFYSNNINDAILYSTPCIIGKGNISLDENKFLSIPADEYVIVIPSNTDTLKINLNTRFILSNFAYIVIGTDVISNVGLINIRVKETQIDSVDDNLSLSIANYYSHQHVYTVSILNSNAILYVNDTLTLDIIATDNGVQVINPIITFLSSNVNVATIINGVINCIAEGNATITATYNGISSSINLTVQSVEIADNYTVNITGLTTVKLGNSITLTSSVFNNGVIDLSKSVVWNISNQDLSSNIYLSILSYDRDNIVLKATSNSAYVNKYVVIRASKSDDLSIFRLFNVQIKSLF